MRRAMRFITRVLALAVVASGSAAVGGSWSNSCAPPLGCAAAHGAEPIAGYQAAVRVEAETRYDWTFVLANQSLKRPPAEWLGNYDSTAQTYEAYVPPGRPPARGLPLVLFISPSAKGTGFGAFKSICEKQGIAFAGPHAAGNDCDTRRRVRIVLDVLDDIRRRHPVDLDRTYIAGFSGGGRIACAIAFALPESFGGVIPICAGGDWRDEAWLRHRVVDRLSIAHLTGETDFNRGEVERFRHAYYSAVGVRSRLWVAAKTGHSVPSAAVLAETLQWLDEDVESRRKQSQAAAAFLPAAGRGAEFPPSREDAAAALLAEGKKKADDAASRYAGLMLMKGALERWPDAKTAADAEQALRRFEQAEDRTWEKDDVAEQRLHLIARARSIDAYGSGPLPQQYAAQQPDMLTAAVRLWQMVIEDGQDRRAVAEARRRIPELTKQLEALGPKK